MYQFKTAKPVWAKGREKEVNLRLGFTATVPAIKKTTLSLACQSIYRLFVNGEFVAAGPARACHGYYRVDEIVLDGLLTAEKNVVAIEVAGYNANSYYLLNQPSFLCAEVIADGKVIAATGRDFVCTGLPYYKQKVCRYTYQRTFTEDYHITPDFDNWRKGMSPFAFEPYETESKTFIDRGVPYPEYEAKNATYISGGSFKIEKPQEYRTNRFLTLPEDTKEQYAGFTRSEMESVLYYDIQEFKCKIEASGDPSKITAGQFSMYDLGLNDTGMLRLNVKCDKQATLYFLFDECLTDGLIDPLRMDACNAIRYVIEPGSYDLMGLEPLTMKFISVLVTEGEVEIANLRMVEYKFHSVSTKLKSVNPQLQAIFNAAIETFRQNTLDIYMDCPSRERAGWLCDSFFTSRVERCLTGESLVERNFIENYLLPESFECQPKGILPMCYPSDHYNGGFIPNWAMWLVVELEEYLARTGDRAMIDAFKDKVYGLFDYFRPFENEIGLLENLKGWIFVEWSKANELVQDVNFPSNMLYAATYEVAGRLYNDQGFINKAAAIKDKIRKLSFDGTFFVDNMVRKEGKLVSAGERTEVCQYYAFFFDLATPQTHPELWKTLITDFGPHRADTKKWPEIYPANAFIGNYLRLDILSRYGLLDQLLGEIEGYFYYMAERTGTLWENVGNYASMNHGFASHVIIWLEKICGLER